MRMVEVTVIIPCYNLARYLPQSVKSVCAQTLPDWECIVVNDGSTDDTEAVARSFADHDPRIRCINQPHDGLPVARNRGLDAASGRYIQFLDADDWIAPAKFERQLVAMKAEANPSLSYCDYMRSCDDSVTPQWTSYRLNPDLDVHDAVRDLAVRWEDGLSIPPNCFLFDARFFERHRIRFDAALGNHEDWDCWMRVLATKPTIFHVPEALASYRYRGGSMTADLSAMREGFLLAIRNQQGLFRADPEMQAVLAATRRRVRRQYRDYTFPRSAYLRANRAAKAALRKYLPHEMQQFLRTWRSRIVGFQHRPPER